MPVTIGVVANVYNEANALPGWLEAHCGFFDHMSIYHSGPSGAWSNDGTMEILEKWKVPIHRGSIDDGFGVCRTAAIRSSPCDFVMVLDADERFWQYAQEMTCGGDSTPGNEVDQILQEYDRRDTHEACPVNWENIGRLGAKLSVSYGTVYAQGAWLRSIIEHGDLDGVKTIRRHWHDFTQKRPTQNWHVHSDWQLRLLRNKDSIYFDPNTKMHETIIGASNVYMPNHAHGPFFDHYHLFYKRMEIDQRRHDVNTYDRIHRGEKPLTWEEFKEGKR